jgi:tRNA(Leu) C34 or U34 (ribose-2'-O)-methylase TrmL
MQANFFGRIVMIDPEFDDGAVKNDRVDKKDLAFYSMCNNVLIDIEYSESVDAFLESDVGREERQWVAAALEESSVNLYSREAIPVLNGLALDGVLFMGSEAQGLPEAIINDARCQSVMIPAMSASVNVGVAFGMVLAAVMMRREDAREELRDKVR